jgi:drug/metabolite transporter (DMT)-like permease
VVFVGAIAWLLYRERPTRTSILIIPVVLVGVSLISGLGRADAFGSDPIAGALAGVGAAVTYAGFLLVFRHSMRGRRERPVGPLLDATIGATVANLALAYAAGGVSLRPTWPAHGWLLLLALGSQVFGWILISHALPRLAGLETAMLLLIQPAMTVVWSQLLFDEPLATAQWAGVAIVLGGILLVAVRGTVEEERKPAG